MKLSAPLPPPEPGPEPTIEPTPGREGTLPPAAPAVPTEKPPTKPATWPTWLPTADLGLVLLTLALTFLVASFAVRNSDVWLHLAAGKRLATGDYKLGTDPFSYTAADRTWINHSWLFDLGSFLLYSGDGFLVVLVKALAIVGAIGLVLAIRRPGQPLWPWTIFATLAVLASSVHFTFRPYIGSLVFLALTLLLVFRMPSRPGSWRLPIAIGVAFCLWSNVDGWFLLGPAALILLTVGEFVQRKVWAAEPEVEAKPDPIGLPDLATLMRATVVGTLACMVNPHHIGIWELPFELIGGASAGADPRITILVTHPIGGRFWQNAGIGYNLGGIAYVILLLSGIYAAFLSGAVGRLFGPAAEVDPLPLPLAILWVGFAALSLLTFFAIPFFALATVPLVASRWNSFSANLVLLSNAERRTRLLLTGSVGGRMFTAVSLIALGIAAWPGWLHPPASCWWESGNTHPGSARRVEWRIESDAELQRNAEWLQEARRSGRLPAASRGILASIDLANYCAWFAPDEKVFANGRFNHHRPELKDLTQLRRGLGLFQERAEPPDLREAEEVLARHNAVYLGVALQSTDPDRKQIYSAPFPIRELWLNWNNWSPWYLNGRSTVVGWRASPRATDPTFTRLALSVEEFAYGRDVKPTAAVQTNFPFVNQSIWDEILHARRATPAGAEDALAWLSYKDRQQSLNILTQQTAALLRLIQPGIATPTIAPAVFEARDEFLASQRRLSHPSPADGSFRPYPILALRTARRAIAESPDHPDGYYALALALADRDLPIADGDRNVALMTAYRQCFLRMPPASEFKRAYYLASPTDVALNLARLYLGQRFRTGEFQGTRVDSGSIGEMSGGGLLYQIPAAPGKRAEIHRVPPGLISRLPAGSTQVLNGLYILPLDLARQMLLSAEEYAKVEIADADMRTSILKSLEDERKSVDAAYKSAQNLYRPEAEKNPKLGNRFGMAMGVGLVGEALVQLRESDLAKEFGELSTKAALQMIAIELAVGRLEEAAADLAALREELDKVADQAQAASPRFLEIRRLVTELELQKLQLEGNYGEAGKHLEELAGRFVGQYPPLDAATHPYMRGFDPAKTDELPYQLFGVGWPAFAMFAATDTPLSLVSRYAGSIFQYQRYTNARQEIENRMRSDSQFFFQRGFLALLEGDIEGAKKRFQSCHRTPPEGWKIPPVRHREAEVYLRQIEAVEKRSKP